MASLRQTALENSTLGKPVNYDTQYNPELLFPIPRKAKREEIGIINPAQFFGYDLWNHYEVSWLNEKGKPIVALAEIFYDCASSSIIESKSLKLYFNSLNNMQFKDVQAVERLVAKDIADRIESDVTVRIKPINSHQSNAGFNEFEGVCIDEIDVACTIYQVQPTLLSVESDIVQESLYSHLLKSNCLITNQPDWASVQITYKGPKINHSNLLQYIVSYRNHRELHEHCIERIFMDITHQCHPEELTVYGRFTRRGGIDINPYRSTQSYISPMNIRLSRQ